MLLERVCKTFADDTNVKIVLSYTRFIEYDGKLKDLLKNELALKLNVSKTYVKNDTLYLVV